MSTNFSKDLCKYISNKDDNICTYNYKKHLQIINILKEMNTTVMTKLT